MRNELSGTVAGHSVQAGEIHGDVHFHAARAEPLVPRQLPRPTANFVGRAEELRALAGSDAPVQVIHGTAGVGKTQLALQWASQVAERFPHGQLHANLRGFDPSGEPVKPDEVLHGFLDALGVHPQRVPPGLDAKTALYRSLVARRSVLVVLDNARDADQVRPLLPGGTSSLTLITSRERLTGLVVREGARPLEVGLLTDAGAVEYLTRIVGAERVAAEEESARVLCSRCAGLPLALSVVAARAVERPTFSLRDLVAELDEEAQRLDAFEDGDLRAVLSWSYRALKPGTARLFRLLGNHPGPDVGVHAAAGTAGIAVSETRTMLAELSRAGLLQEWRRGRFRFHDLLRFYAGELAHDASDDVHAAQQRFVDYFLTTSIAGYRYLEPHGTAELLPPAPSPDVAVFAISGYDQAMAWFTEEHPALRDAVGVANGSSVWRLAWAWAVFLRRRGHREDRVFVHQKAVAAAVETGNRQEEARSRRLLGHAHRKMSDPRTAIGELTLALEIFQEIGDREGEILSRLAIGRVHEVHRNYPEALAHARSAFALLDSATGRAARADTLNALGWFTALSRPSHAAHAHCVAALDLYRTLGFLEGQADALLGVGYAAHRLGRTEEAIAHYSESLRLDQELGDLYYEAFAREHLGDAHDSLGHRADADREWRSACAIYTSLGHPDASRVRQKLSPGS
ncbi:tetratricopeptide repeat protein [Allokutzneria albata]|uniref:Tetratricopeptide repeat-containing protein n=1 Tax=Allokutzneria albata TaxID=211114 RepID=A0A1G9TW54_ALLAB|nr:tetratricopeptide repeat protein [Allokutzneria albata]SDM52010.1 Tetratricopeptide repeat-containing protein [Allokutzneria albata]